MRDRGRGRCPPSSWSPRFPSDSGGRPPAPAARGAQKPRCRARGKAAPWTRGRPHPSRLRSAEAAPIRTAAPCNPAVPQGIALGEGSQLQPRPCLHFSPSFAGPLSEGSVCPGGFLTDSPQVLEMCRTTLPDCFYTCHSSIFFGLF